MIGRESTIGNESSGVNGVIGIGSYAYVDKHYDIGIGYDADVYGRRAIAIGYNADIAEGDEDVIKIGYSALSNGDGGLIFGNYASVTNDYGLAIGYTSTADSASIALGANASATGSYSVAIGHGASTSIDNSMVLGGATVTDRVGVGIGTAAPNSFASLTLGDTE